MNHVRRAVRAALAVVALGVVVLFTPTPAAASTCSLNVGGHQGYYICEYGYTYITWPDGHHQYFVVGTDYAVYDTYQIGTSSSWSNWRNLGGAGRSGVDVDYLSSSRIDISVVGTDAGWWCKRWTSAGGWTGWWACFR